MEKFKQKIKNWFIPGTENDHKPHILRNKTLIVFAIGVLLIKLAVFGLFLYFPNSAYFSVITTNRLIELTNQSRAQSNLPALKIDEKLSEAAYLKAQDILEQNYFAHTSPQGITPWYWFKQANYNYQYAGENLAIDFIDAESLYGALMNSPSHKQNILSTHYKEIGIAVITGEFNGKKTTIAVQHFGSQFEQPSIAQIEPAQTKPTETSPELEKLKEKELASARETKEEPILTPKEEVIESEILAKTQEKIKEFEKFAKNIQTQEAPKILGTLVSKSEEITTNIYIYALLFVVLALILNIFIKLEVQRKSTIISAILIIGLIAILIIISDKELLNIGLKIL